MEVGDNIKVTYDGVEYNAVIISINDDKSVTVSFAIRETGESIILTLRNFSKNG